MLKNARSFILILFFISGALSACTERHKVISIAEEAVPQKLESQFRQEAADYLGAKPIFTQNFVHLMIKKSESSVAFDRISGETATVGMDVHVIPEEARQALLRIMARQDCEVRTGFNAEDALSGIMQNLNLDSNARSSISFQFNLKKQGEDWALSPSL